LQPFIEEIRSQRLKEIETISRHMEISLNALIDRQQLRMADLFGQQAAGDTNSPVAANIKQVEDRLDELNSRLERRRTELQQERHCTISDIRKMGVAWVLPHPDRSSPMVAPFVRDDEIERLAVDAVIAFERARGWEVASVEAETCPSREFLRTRAGRSPSVTGIFRRCISGGHDGHSRPVARLFVQRSGQIRWMRFARRAFVRRHGIGWGFGPTRI
jgi:hypothetical protein